MHKAIQYSLIFVTLVVLVSPAMVQKASAQMVGLPEGAKARLGKGYKTGSSIFSKDGTRFVISSNIGLWIYDVHTGEEVTLLTGHPSDFTVMASSPDGSMLASANENAISLWEIDTGREVATLTEHTENITTLVFSPNNTTLASGSEDNTIRLWNATTGQLLSLPLSEHTGDVTSIAFSPDSQTLASGSRDNTIRLWSATTGQHLATLEEQIVWGAVTHEGHTGDVTAVVFSPDGATLASGDTDNTIRLWDVGARQHRTALTGHTGTVTALTFSKDGTILVSGSRDNTIRLWNTATGKHLDTLEGHEDDVIVLAFSFDGTTLASGEAGGITRLWAGDTGQHLDTLSYSLGDEVSGDPIHAIAFSPDGLILSSGSGHTYSERYQYQTSGWCGPGGWYYYRSTNATFYRGSTQLWSILTRKHRSTLTEYGAFVRALAFSSDGTTLVSAGEESYLIRNYCGVLDSVVRDYSLKLWDTNTGAHIADLEGHSGDVSSIAFSHDGNLLASGSWDDTIRLWNPTTGGHLATFTGHSDDVNAIAFSPDSETLASGSDDDTIRLWNSDGTIRATLSGHGGNVTSVVFSPDGGTLASGSTDSTIRLWNPTTGAHIATLEGHTGRVSSIAFSVDGETLASGSWDNTIRLWNSTTREHLATFSGHRGAVNAVAFSPDGRTLASGSSDRTILLWEITQAPSQNRLDINGDGIVNVLDLTLVASRFGQTGQNVADVNGDSVVDRQDIIQIIDALEAAGAAPSAHPRTISTLTAEKLQRWIGYAKQLNLSDPTFQRGIAMLEQLLAALTEAQAIPVETALLPNYPNPFNPETWIPYRLAEDAFVTLSIYDGNGQIVRALDVGHQVAAIYERRSKAIYWDGRNEVGEPVASGVYFYHLSAGDYSATRKMLILK